MDSVTEMMVRVRTGKLKDRSVVLSVNSRGKRLKNKDNRPSGTFAETNKNSNTLSCPQQRKENENLRKYFKEYSLTTS